MPHLIREISKLCMFIVTWAFPILLSQWNENNKFLWLFVLSVIVTGGVFSHYEELEKTDNLKDESNETNE